MNRSIIDTIPLCPTSFEKEIFPKLIESKKLNCFSLCKKIQKLSKLILNILAGFWADLGIPKNYLIGISLYLNFKKTNVLIDDDADIGQNCVIEENVTIGKGCRIGNGVRLRNCAIFENCIIEQSCLILDSIIGWENKIGKFSRIEGCVFGRDVTVSEESFVQNTRVSPNKILQERYIQDQNIM